MDGGNAAVKVPLKTKTSTLDFAMTTTMIAAVAADSVGPDVGLISAASSEETVEGTLTRCEAYCSHPFLLAQPLPDQDSLPSSSEAVAAADPVDLAPSLSCEKRNKFGENRIEKKIRNDGKFACCR